MAETRREVSVAAPAATSGRWRRLIPLLIVAAVALVVVAMGWHRQLSFEALVRHRTEVETFVTAHHFGAVLLFVAVYVVAVMLSLPGAVFLTVAGGLLFGTVVGGFSAIVAATLGATLLFLIARSAIGGWLMRRAGATATALAEGFRRDAFHYLLFLRLVPVFPFWVVNLVAALCGVHLGPFVVATALGIVPGTLAFAFLGAGLDSAVAAQASELRRCIAAGQSDCPVGLDVWSFMNPELVSAFVILGLVALIPIAVRHFKPMQDRPSL
jgi:uncharacterized membrane protein YdjX (TVP38/TMEM64 family)